MLCVALLACLGVVLFGCSNKDEKPLTTEAETRSVIERDMKAMIEQQTGQPAPVGGGQTPPTSAPTPR
jgi:hypothetical protein